MTHASLRLADEGHKGGRARLALAYGLGWLGLGVFLGINVFLSRRNAGQPLPAWQPLTWEVTSAAMLSVLTIVVYRFEKRVPLNGPGWPRRLLLHVPVVLGFSIVHTAGIVALRMPVYRVFGAHYDVGNPLVTLTYELQRDVLAYGVIVAFCVGVRTWHERREQELAATRLARDLSDARLAQLTAQIEPHFVFNTLNTIANRMHEDVEAADRLIADFGDLLRASMIGAESTTVCVAEEMALVERYIALMSERYRGKLDACVDVEPTVRDARIPRLLLQPLVENAFEHGLATGHGRVTVRIMRMGNSLLCEVGDNGTGLPHPLTPGLGLTNVRRRLEALYPGQHRFDVSSSAGGGTRVQVSIPLQVDDVD